MDAQDLHDLLTGRLGLIPQATESAVSRSYFHQRVEWHPGRCTRVFRVLFAPNGEPAQIQLCASSDNNNSVLIQRPFDAQRLADLAAQEIGLIEAGASSPFHG